MERRHFSALTSHHGVHQLTNTYYERNPDLMNFDWNQLLPALSLISGVAGLWRCRGGASHGLGA